MRILLVEDESDLGAAVQKALTQANYIVDWVQDGNQAWGFLGNHWTHYSLGIFDWLLPGLTGIELCQRLRANQNPLPILILTAKDKISDRVAGLDAGADDYLVKPFGMEELLARLRALHRRSPQLQANTLTVGSITLDYGTANLIIQNTEADSVRIPLTAKEFQLIEYFMKHPQQILSSEKIKNQLWAIASESTSNVVAAQVRILRRKLADHGLTNPIETVYGLGYRFDPA
ncbi:two-component system response regulator RppA [Synechococcus sp. PCC 6312]|uniref:two-component system response regulator RppA n=1 Tax=Synechococcus sp. (strain ATCC 27167 / PCC 6312) TaxID=195253 RepID=UPI00029EF69B|nr:two-component system response regulator RppA [Synechococcus sp. PCC 6312]AFY61878.1 response regulator with CheY-like receiver domain and winged-helix DNA-binding domain [Synechococcus sp. PCC 6312]